MMSASPSPTSKLPRLLEILSNLDANTFQPFKTDLEGKYEISPIQFVSALLTAAPGRERMCDEIFDAIELTFEGREWVERLVSIDLGLELGNHGSAGVNIDIMNLADSLKEKKFAYISVCFTLWTEKWLRGFLLPRITEANAVLSHSLNVVTAAAGTTPPSTPYEHFEYFTSDDKYDEYDDPPGWREDAKRKDEWKKQLYERDGILSPFTGFLDLDAPHSKIEEMDLKFPGLNANHLSVGHLIPYTIINKPGVQSYIRRFMNAPSFPLSPADLGSLANALIMDSDAKYWWYSYRISIECVRDGFTSESEYEYEPCPSNLNFNSLDVEKNNQHQPQYTYVLRFVNDRLGIIETHKHWARLKDKPLPFLYKGSGDGARELPRLSPEFCDFQYALAKAVCRAGLDDVLWRILEAEMDDGEEYWYSGRTF